MVTPIEMRKEVQKAIDEDPIIVRFRYFTGSSSADEYDNHTVLTQAASDVWTSGCLQPINNYEDYTSSQAQYGEQGYIKHGDAKLYILGDVVASGIFKIGLGSPNTEQFRVTKGGIKTWSIDNTDVYHKLIIEKLSTGSLYGE